MRKSAWIAIGSLLAAAVLVSIRMQENLGEAQRQKDAVRAQNTASQAPDTEADGGAKPTKDQSAEAVAPSAPEKEDVAFKHWVKKEAASVDAVHVDADKKREEIRNVVRRLTPQQSRQLLATARDPHSPAGEKILSTYLLVEGGPLSRGELTALIASPLENVGPHEAHSEAELVGVREKSLRIMAIDGLFARAQRDPEAREALAKVISDIQDPYLRGYAEDKYRRLSQ